MDKITIYVNGWIEVNREDIQLAGYNAQTGVFPVPVSDYPGDKLFQALEQGHVFIRLEKMLSEGILSMNDFAIDMANLDASEGGL